MSVRPILFSSPMVRALLREIEAPGSGKTQTRRVLKPQPPAGYELVRIWAAGQLALFERDDDCVGLDVRMRWRVGDLLWVRENILQSLKSRSDPSGEYESYWTRERVEYMADVPPPQKRHLHPDLFNSAFMQSRPSIHMPQWASRITLRVTGVKVERLHSISRGDAMEEGCPFPNMADGPNPVDWFRGIWTEINGEGSWDENPWVVAITFEVIGKNVSEVTP